MAKREFIEKGEVLKNWHTVFNDDNGVFEDVIYKDDIENHTITEQEILNPYLKAVEAEAIKYSGTGEAEVQAYDEGLWKAIEIIKNLLSEQQK